jgi:hypothetical protein
LIGKIIGEEKTATPKTTSSIILNSSCFPHPHDCKVKNIQAKGGSEPVEEGKTKLEY